MTLPRYVQVGCHHLVVEGARVWVLRTEVEARRVAGVALERRLDIEHVVLGCEGAASELAWHAGVRGPDRTLELPSDATSGFASRTAAERVMAALMRQPPVMLDGGFRPPIDPVPVEHADDPPFVPPIPIDPGGPSKTKDSLWYEIRVVDELGEPIEGAAVSLSVNGSPRRLVSDGDGRVRVDDATTGFAIARLTDIDGLRDVLGPRWEQVRDGDWLDETEDHGYIDCSDPLPAVKVRAERLHTIVVQPRVVCARLLDLLFDTNKAFLLPSALEHIRAVRKLYDERADAALLIVGHTDPTGDPSVNDPLSLARAKSVKAYLTDDVDAWLEHYESETPAKARWGAIEDQRMLEAVLARTGEALTDTPLRHFQATRGLEDDGILGPVTRRALVTEYMAADGTTLPPGVEPIVHGCGESFPRDDDPDSDTDETEHEFQRRVELFFFDGELGVLPPPPGEISAQGSREYPEWRRRSAETLNYVAPPDPSTLLTLRLHDDDHNPMANVPFVVTIGKGVPFHGHTDDEGFAFVRLPPICPERIRVRWGEHPVFEHAHELDVFPDCFSDDVATRNITRLHNLGYAPTIDLEAAVRQFQAEYGVDADPEPVGLEDGTLPPDSQQRLDTIWAQKNSNATTG